jgi:hypothetical protein
MGAIAKFSVAVAGLDLEQHAFESKEVSALK